MVGNGVGLLIERLRARREEIELAIFERARDLISDSASDGDAEYVTGLRATVTASLDYCLTGIERDQGSSLGPVQVPAQALAQARRAARNRVSLDAVLRRYMVGQAILLDFILQDAEAIPSRDKAEELRGISRALSRLLDELVLAVAREYVGELRRAGRSSEQRMLDRVRMLLSGERMHDAKLDYELQAEHLGVICRGPRAHEALRSLARMLDRRLLLVDCGAETVWGWLGGSRTLPLPDLERGLSDAPHDALLAVGEPARGLQGWRLTHRQAQEALLVALRRPRPLTRYRDVALLAAALRNETLSRSLLDELYLSPLRDSRDGGAMLRRTLRAYLSAERNTTAAAATLGVVRNTVENRLRLVEERLGQTLHPFPAELEIALALDELNAHAPQPNHEPDPAIRSYSEQSARLRAVDLSRLL